MNATRPHSILVICQFRLRLLSLLLSLGEAADLFFGEIFVGEREEEEEVEVEEEGEEVSIESG